MKENWLEMIADALEIDGYPDLMIIVGRTGDVSVSVKEAGTHAILGSVASS